MVIWILIIIIYTIYDIRSLYDNSIFDKFNINLVVRNIKKIKFRRNQYYIETIL